MATYHDFNSLPDWPCTQTSTSACFPRSLPCTLGVRCMAWYLLLRACEGSRNRCCVLLGVKQPEKVNKNQQTQCSQCCWCADLRASQTPRCSPCSGSSWMEQVWGILRGFTYCSNQEWQLPPLWWELDEKCLQRCSFSRVDKSLLWDLSYFSNHCTQRHLQHYFLRLSH